ncbi:MAG TPA: hypothetical protein VGB85_17680 [Nannocystis sp.]|jgi:hypothetical protein
MKKYMSAVNQGYHALRQFDALSLEEFAQCIDRAIVRLTTAVRIEGVNASWAATEGLVRRWLSHLDTNARTEVFALALSSGWERHSTALARSITKAFTPHLPVSASDCCVSIDHRQVVNAASEGEGDGRLSVLAA